MHAAFGDSTKHDDSAVGLLYLKMGSMICTSRSVITSTLSVMNMSHRSAVAPLAASGGGVAVVGAAERHLLPFWSASMAQMLA